MAEYSSSGTACSQPELVQQTGAQAAKKAEFINCSVLPRSTGFPGEGIPRAGWSRWRVEGWEQQQLNGQSRERDPGLPTPALSLDLHSNRHQGAELQARAELAA